MTMNSYPLIKTKWSNERVMSIVFLAAVLYMLPGWVKDPGGILNFIAVLALSLVIDVAANFIRYKRPICAVSAAVTAAVLYVLSAGIPLWEQLLAVGEKHGLTPVASVRHGTSTQHCGGRLLMIPLFITFPLKRNGSFVSSAFMMNDAYSPEDFSPSLGSAS
jgi:UPF0716 family protein affecting phage T7 exclusion